MKKSNLHITTGYEAVANIAYKTNEVFPIYPCTPTSEMSALVEEWSAKKRENIFGNVPRTFEMQSEAGVAGAMHGALQVGSLSSTFTASQGLLLMIPNMFKIAGELTPNVIHVATRSIATHALSIFGDHSDIMAARQTGYAFLGSASVQEAQDFALIAQLATLKARIPFVHFFDGFRTSHEMNSIIPIDDAQITKLLEPKVIRQHRSRALDPNRPVLRGTTQGPDVFFQSREAQNSYYDICPTIVQEKMNDFANITGRHYHLFEYIGHAQAEEVIISMASSTETIESTIKYLNQRGNKYGLIKVRLFRPFSLEHLVSALPKTVRSIAVMDRTKEPGSAGEPLYLEVVQGLLSAFQNGKIKYLPNIIGGRYGLSSKEFTPAMVNSIFNNLKREQPKNNFTVGVTDDVTHLSLPFDKDFRIKNESFQAIFYNESTKFNIESFSNLLENIGNTKFVQGYTQCYYKKSNTKSVSYLRLDTASIKAPYLIDHADFVGYENVDFIQYDMAIQQLKPKAILLINSDKNPLEFWQSISLEKQKLIRSKNVLLFIADFRALSKLYIINDRKVAPLHACFLYLKNDFPLPGYLSNLGEFIHEVDTSVLTDTTKVNGEASNSLLVKLMHGRGDDVKVSELPVDGTYPSNTSIFNKSIEAVGLPIWNPEACTQCGACSMACPQGALRIKMYDDMYLNQAPKGFKSIQVIEEDVDLLNFTVQINSDQCNNCKNCLDACQIKDALQIKDRKYYLAYERENWKHFDLIPEYDRMKIDVTKVSQQQLQEPLFKYATSMKGSGEAPYLKLLSQLFGERLLVANATGTSSIFGGSLPTTPWSTNAKGQGPAWANSLFEDNAEFGLGFRLGLDQQESHDGNSNNESNKSVWIVGGDGWAYDIGYGGLDHVLASNKNINILVLDNEVYDNTGGQLSKATPYGAEAKFAFNGKVKQKKDLGLTAMNYDHVYVASVAIGADQEQTLKAFNEAESFNGPSIIIAYCHSSSHGIDMTKPGRYHKAAVASGQWLLFRNDPRRIKQGLNALQLDSKSPTIPIEQYLRLESRFHKLFENDPKSLKLLMQQIQSKVDRKYKRFVSLSSEQQKVNV